jgi:hypothetical protein
VIDAAAAEAAAGKPPSFLWQLAGSVVAFAVFFAMCAALGKHHLAGVSSALLFVLACHGLTQLVTESKIAFPIVQLAGKLPLVGSGLYTEGADGKPDGGLLSCSMCLGLWIGALLAAAGVTMYPVGSEGLTGMRDLVVHGIAGSAVGYLAHVIVEKLKK